jgi:aminoglycoside phosphotransferase (APT) family kinase protein
MHDDEVHTDVSLVGRLVAAQFPRWAHFPIQPVASYGTDNAIYRLGDHLVVRLPRIREAAERLGKERRWLPRLAPFLPLEVPAPLAKGMPGEDYPWEWSVYRWLEGETATLERITDLRRAAIDLARFIAALQRIDPSVGPPPGQHNSFRGAPLAKRDASTRAAIASLHGEIDVGAVTAAWEAALRAPESQRPPVWIHGDLLAGNLLVEDGRLSAVIDFGCLGVGDSACELAVAWTLLSGEARDVFRAELSVDEATWTRGRGWALSWALIALPYYLETNAVIVGNARRAIAEVLGDHRRGAPL